MVLCSGHVSPEETLTTFRRAAEIGITRLVVTHPHADFVGASVAQMRELAELGAVNEMLYTFVTPAVEHRQTMAHIATQIRDIGIENCYISTDGGQAINPPPTEMYRRFIEGLLHHGFTEDEITLLAHTTPARVLLD
jgi:hypothetical protein